MKRQGRHRLPITRPDLPEWAMRETNDCLRSVAEEVYTARALAVNVYRAYHYPSCAQLLRAGDREIDDMADTSSGYRSRCSAGERALRKFWEAKACARRCGGYDEPKRKRT